MIIEVILRSDLTPTSFSKWLIFIWKFSTLMLILLFVLTNKWHLSWLLFSSKLLLNYLNNLVEASYKDLTTPIHLTCTHIRWHQHNYQCQSHSLQKTNWLKRYWTIRGLELQLPSILLALTSYAGITITSNVKVLDYKKQID